MFSSSELTNKEVLQKHFLKLLLLNNTLPSFYNILRLSSWQCIYALLNRVTSFNSLISCLQIIQPLGIASV